MRENNFTEWLEEQHSLIMGEEKDALAALANGDTAAYRQKMASKAELLAELFDKAKDRLEELPAPIRMDAQKTLKNFSANANMAMNLDSVFYMSALLYPDDHEDGQPDNLRRLIDKIRGARKN